MPTKLKEQSKLKEANKLFAQAEKLRTKAFNLGQEFTEANSPYKVGDKLHVKSSYGSDDWLVVQMLRFDKDSVFPEKYYLNCGVWTKGWKRPAERRANLHISEDNDGYGPKYEILEHIPAKVKQTATKSV